MEAGAGFDGVLLPTTGEMPGVLKRKTIDPKGGTNEHEPRSRSWCGGGTTR
jgi:hypothetical protein